MLSDVQLRTVRAALRYWREEICPSGSEAAAPYLVQPTVTYLSAADLQDLETRFLAEGIRYLAYQRGTEQILVPELILDAAHAERMVTSDVDVATVLLRSA